MLQLFGAAVNASSKSKHEGSIPVVYPFPLLSGVFGFPKWCWSALVAAKWSLSPILSAIGVKMADWAR